MPEHPACPSLAFAQDVPVSPLGHSEIMGWTPGPPALPVEQPPAAEHLPAAASDGSPANSPYCFPPSASRNIGLAASSVIHLGLLVCVSLLLAPFQPGDQGALGVSLEFSADAPILAPAELVDVSLAEIEFSNEEKVVEAELSFDPLVDAPELDLASTSSPPSGGGEATGGEDDGTPRGTFFGTVAYGEQFVYVLDISGSMNEVRDPTIHATRLHTAMAELLRSVETLSPNQSFYVILFSDRTRLMFDELRPIPEPILATRANKDRLQRWLMDTRADNGTDPRVAIRVALTMRPSAVFLLSDGEFNGRQNRYNLAVLPNNPTVEEIVSSLDHELAPIHTIALENTRNSKRMKWLAEETGGDYRYVPPLERMRRPVAGGDADLASNAVWEQELDERRATHLSNDLLQKAIALEQQGKQRAAARRYRTLINRYPHTAAAQNAAARLQRPSIDQPPRG